MCWWKTGILGTQECEHPATWVTTMHFRPCEKMPDVDNEHLVHGLKSTRSYSPPERLEHVSIDLHLRPRQSCIRVAPHPSQGPRRRILNVLKYVRVLRKHRGPAEELHGMLQFLEEWKRNASPFYNSRPPYPSESMCVRQTDYGWADCWWIV
ncbi:hypothetical protein P175DRAFT_0529247 [Aspergillus ochraceoroseus IBT 24754]|uniref:Uncharacterized protein n=1 Tax=Aspergillus ochraceoroseus IBT 24754 TaxID=1392256 RepID=A0A2T5MAX0_9EURO|nr:uncharacterized protein P175DRAFT_0529247 [Aspergillus ochraceoroseus IBT 24754]PTU25677.1 hypothetical protein P175DRAFT_0529247 [Aspergillus ochraceoroseus IBT 24754]